jgi:hypothetical protein
MSSNDEKAGMLALGKGGTVGESKLKRRRTGIALKEPADQSA